MLYAVAAAALAACASVPARVRQDVEFVRGCWVAKQAPGQPPVFLRLLPEGADGPDYRGQATIHDGGTTRRGSEFVFARDGSWFGIRFAPDLPLVRYPAISVGAPAPGLSRAAFGAASPDGLSVTYVAEGDKEHLRVFLAMPSGATINDLVNVERDGCD